ncbi:MAG: PD40 domain-containing protein, partial [Acidobacteria bacterium]|nr:PD40 domain-containing protein [Acidobacteriota bacterium]
MKHILTILWTLLAGSCIAAGGQTQLFQQPSISATQIVFHHAGDLWIVSRDGGEARRLTSAPGQETHPAFSPDGNWIAFTGEYDGNVDVFLIPAAGGVPRRLTYHPGNDTAAGWTRDGSRILLRSPRNSYSRFNRLFTMPVEGVFPEELPLPMAEEGSFSPDGSRLAYMPLARAFDTWKRYRGGRTSKIWIARLSDSSVEEIPRENSNDFNPMWVDHRIFFLSDRDGPATLYSYDTKTKKVTREIVNDGYDLKSASAGPGAVCYEQFGGIYLYDIRSRKPRRVGITLQGDMTEVRPRIEKVANRIEAAMISPTGAGGGGGGGGGG